MTGLARCICDPGFQDDGLDYCSACVDPMFSYPDCQSRNWIISSSDYNCEKLPSNLPVYLYKNESVKQSMIYQNEEG
jgi:hypothetical protein